MTIDKNREKRNLTGGNDRKQTKDDSFLLAERNEEIPSTLVNRSMISDI